MHNTRTTILSGLLFAVLWASASVAGKFGLKSAEPLVLFTMRFLGAGVLLLLYSTMISKSRVPVGQEWKHLIIFGAFNTTLYLGLFAIALDTMTPGITTLAVALNPVLISVMTSLWTNRPVKLIEWLGVALGLAGVLTAALPLLKSSHATTEGLVIIGLSQLSYSIGAVYYASVHWKLPRLSINGWQVLLGGILLLPFAFLLHREENVFALSLFLALAWLIIPVSIVAVQLWLRLLKSDPVKASLWLFLCPVFGFLYSFLLFDEPITVYTVIGTAMVMVALYLGQQREVK